MNEFERILNALSAVRVSAQPEEAEIHDAVARALADAGIEAVHEFRLAPGCRIDFACGSIGIEIKKGRPRSQVLQRQLRRYLEGTALTGLIVVSQAACALPDMLCGKRVCAVSLNRLWGVAVR